MNAADLSGQVAAITGASRGLGRHIALRLAEAGMKLVIGARSADDLHSVADEVRERGADVHVLPFDAASPAATRQFVQQASAHFGGLDVLVYNAGSSTYKPLSEWSADEIDAVLDVNLRGLMHAAHEALPHLKARRGQLLVVASDVGRRVIPNMAPYVAAKHGAVAFAGSLLREVRAEGVRVTSLLPGIIDTYFNGSTEGSRPETWALRPAHVAEVVYHALTQPPYVVLDEITVHPLEQDF